MIMYDVAVDHHDEYEFEHEYKYDNENKMNKYRD